jgi:hypothetical protein
VTDKTSISDITRNLNKLTALGQRMMLDNLRAEIAAFQTILPLLPDADRASEDQGRKDTNPDPFDNMPV